MTTETFLLKPLQIAELRSRLEEDDRFEFRPLDYGHFSARGPRVVINAYRSGKVVVQGAEAEMTRDRFIADLGSKVEKKKPRDDGLPSGPLIGSDEAGKGDYFGSLVVAAVGLEAGREQELQDLGARDSKTMTDDHVLQADVHIREAFPHEVLVFEPGDYNDQHDSVGNLNKMLAKAHAAVIKAVHRQAPSLDRALVDRFGAESLVRKALGRLAKELEVIQLPRAEGHPAVAAASILARAAFLHSIDLATSWAREEETLPKGGSNNRIVAAGRRILERDGRAGLRKVAKLHFKTTASVERRS